MTELGFGDRVVGIYPVSVTADSGVPEIFGEELGEPRIIEADGGPNLEEILALEPDLIIGNDAYVGETYDQLQQIAPTVAIGVDQFVYFDTLRAVAEVLGVGQEAEDLIDRYDARVGELAGTLEIGSVSVVQIPDADRFRVYAGGWLVSTLEELGAEVVPTEIEGIDGEGIDGNGRAEISLERVSIVQGDTVLAVGVTEEQIEVLENYADINGLWATLPAVEAGRVFLVNFSEFSGQFGVAGYLAVLDQIEEIFG